MRSEPNRYSRCELELTIRSRHILITRCPPSVEKHTGACQGCSPSPLRKTAALTPLCSRKSRSERGASFRPLNSPGEPPAAAARRRTGRPCTRCCARAKIAPKSTGARDGTDAVFRRLDRESRLPQPLPHGAADGTQAHKNEALHRALAAPAVAFAPQAQQAASVKLEAHKEVAAATLAAGALLAPFAAFAGDIESGETLFAGNCAACHAGGNNVIAAEKTLRKDALDATSPAAARSSVVTQVTNGKNAMPAFGGRLSDERDRRRRGYVIDQANGDKSYD